MTISGGNLSRVSNSLKAFALLSNIQRTSMRLFRQEQHLSTGQRLLSVGDDPLIAEKIVRLTRSAQKQDQILENLRHADDQLAASDTAVTEIGDLLIEAARIASEQAGSLQTADERAAQSVLIDGIITQLASVGNRQFQGLYLFGGQEVATAPFNTDLGRVTYVGDTGERRTLADENSQLAFNLTADTLFDLRASVTGGYANFNVQLSTDTRLSELDGAVKAGVRLGSIAVTDGGAGVNFQVDFTGVETVADLIAKFNDAASTASSTLTLQINPADGSALQITGGTGTTQVDEVASGNTAADLGLKKSVGPGDLDGDNVNRRVMLTTKLSDLTLGGLTLANGVVVTNGQLTATITFTGATTVQEVLNKLNNAGVGIRALINKAGDGIEIENLIAGSDLIVGENGGSDAENLGIRTLDAGVSLSRLNQGFGIHPVTGNDIRITNANGVSFEVDLSSAQTVGDVISAIETASTAAGAGITVTTSLGGAGFRLTGPAGPGAIVAEGINLSAVAQELGIAKTGSATVLEGDNVGQFAQTGVFSALYRLRDGLLADDTSEITEAGRLINATQKVVTSVAGQVGAQSQVMQARREQTEDAVAATQILLSQLSDVDYIEAVTRFQEAQTALQANLLSGSQAQNLSLLDFLR